MARTLGMAARAGLRLVARGRQSLRTLYSLELGGRNGRAKRRLQMDDAFWGGGEAVEIRHFDDMRLHDRRADGTLRVIGLG